MRKPLASIAGCVPVLMAVTVLMVVSVLMAVTAPAATAAGPVPVPQDPFYTYSGPVPLSQIAPGTVLAHRQVSLTVLGLTVPAATDQLLYRTTGELGQPTVSVTTVIRPLLALGTRIIAYQTAYDALGAQCDPSYTLQGGNTGDTVAQVEATAITGYVVAGFTVTVPDYEGENLDWGAGQESGDGTLDAIRATEHFLAVGSSTPVGMLGYSGGSIATEWAAELAPGYAPELHIVGAAAGGVPVNFAHNLVYINGGQSWAGVIPAVLVSLGGAFGVDIHPYLSAFGEQVTSQVAGKCIADFAASYPGLTYQMLLGPQYQDPFQIPALDTILTRLVMGTGGTPAAPMLFGVGNSDGTGDGIMIAADVRDLARTYCQRGVPVTYQEYSGLSHTPAAVPFETAALTFLESRFLGLPASTCGTF